MDEGFGGDLVVICNNRPSLRLSALVLAVSKLRFRLRLRLHGVAHNAPSLMAGLRPALSLPVGGHLCVGVF